jgi:hypothetical protein
VPAPLAVEELATSHRCRGRRGGDCRIASDRVARLQRTSDRGAKPPELTELTVAELEDTPRLCRPASTCATASSEVSGVGECQSVLDLKQAWIVARLDKSQKHRQAPPTRTGGLTR